MLSQDKLSRRNFLKLAGVAGVGVGLAACRQAPNNENAAANNAANAGHDHMTAPAAPVGETAEEMDTLHEAGVNIFLENAGKHPEFWGTKLDHTMDGDTKVFKVTCQEVDW